MNKPGMRFCVECGNNLLPAGGAPAPQPSPQPSPQPPYQSPPGYNPHSPAAHGPGYAQPAPGYAQPAPAPAPHAAPQSLSRALGGPLCPRCRGVGDAGAEYCKFCGARYDEGAVPHSPAPMPQPAHAYAPPQAQPQPPTMVQDRPAMGPSASLVSILKDGSDGTVYGLPGDQIDIGRSEGDVLLADDPYLAPRHARVRRDGGRFFIRDLDSFNGIYVRVTVPVEVVDGDMILIGQQVLRFESLADAELPLGPANVRGVMVFGTPEVPRFGRLVQYTTEGVGRDVHYLYRDETVLGRENGDIVFTDDPFLSRRHASITIERGQGRLTLKDLGSSNGTAIRIRGEHELRPGDQFRIGRHLFRFDLGDGGHAGR